MKLHHIGFVVKDLEAYALNLFVEDQIRKVYDPLQGAYLALYNHFGGAFIELIQPASPEAPTYNFLQKQGEGFHHLCYQVADTNTMERLVQQQRLLAIRGPVEALLFDQALVYFYYSRNRQIVEFLIKP